ncbi:imidazole glycerol phosphate synthase subunit HisF [Candidatus Peregrinibacteria bacterium]|jgi:phosphoribosylformimino-5-aminoimidazole carboxamide ribotide isomerase|nr:imidazole glycerol phosphate synthase subunit HisF [Candidatus Peregrinibacteria bacterium]MBT4055754.1 imidazole glycerol phosphate synthase subunit HisF [Candidatus Peregrinibacteria bacterium]
MLIIPAIDLIDGKCVRLSQGDYSQVKNYDQDPIEVAQKFKKQGINFIHIIDLEGAKEGKPINFPKTAEVAETTGLAIQTGGGIRTFEDAEKILNSGIKRVILGTSALANPKLVKDLVSKFGADRIVVSIDAKDGIVMIKGWIEKSDLTLEEAFEKLKDTGLEIIIFTDVKRDGMLKGINPENIKKVLNKGFKIIVAGGVTTQEDIDQLETLNVYGCIIGKALYEGKINLPNPNPKPNTLSKRIIPCMDIKEGRVVKGTNFINLKDAGDPVELGKFYSDMGADELIFLDIMATVEKRDTLYELVRRISENINIPFTVGGGINTLEDIKILLQNGADKISIGSKAAKNPNFVKEASQKFGSQCIVISVDPKKIDGKWKLFIKGGRENTNIDAIEFAKQMEQSGAGELLVNSLDRDGMKNGYDIPLLKAITSAVNIPVIASSGAGSKEDFLEAFEEANVDAALAASLFHYGEIQIPDLKKYLAKKNITIRI